MPGVIAIGFIIFLWVMIVAALFMKRRVDRRELRRCD